MNENGVLDLIFMFIMARFLFIFSLIFTASFAAEMGHLLKPFARRMASTQIVSPNKSSVAIMGHHLCCKAEPHSRVDDRKPGNAPWKLLRASSTIMLNLDENSLSTKPVPAYQITNKYCVLYEKGQAPKIIQSLPFGDENKIIKRFQSFKENRFEDKRPYARFIQDHMLYYAKELYLYKLLEIYDTNFLDEDIKSAEHHAQTLLPGVPFIENITQLKTISFFDNADQFLYSSLLRPIIPNILFIKEPKDILEIAKFYKDFCNYMEYHFCLTQESIPLDLQTFINAFKTEPSRLLYLVRPDSSGNYYTETRINRLKAYSLLREDRGELLFNLDYKDPSFNVDEIKTSWKTDFKEQSKDWFDENENLFRACFKFAEMIWNKPLPKLVYPGYPKKPAEIYRQNHGYKVFSTGPVRPYETEDEFQKDLLRVDSDFDFVLKNREQNLRSSVTK